MRGRLLRFVIGLVVAASATSGCLSSTGLTGARSVGEDQVEFAVGLSFTPDTSGNIIGLPALDVVVRYGLSDTADLGFRINSFGVFNVDAKVELTDATDTTVALLPTVGINWGRFFYAVGQTKGAVIQLGVTALVDVHANRDITLTVAPAYNLLFETDRGTAVHMVGGELNSAFDVGAGVRLQPYVTGHWALGVPANELMSTVLSAGVATRYAP